MPILSDENPFRFSTKYWDQESGLYYYGYRYYSPELGRFLSKDPIEGFAIQKGDLHQIIGAKSKNLYFFVHNSPISTVDLLGLVSEGETCCPDKHPPCDIRLFSLIDNGTEGTSVKAGVLSLVTEGDCQDLHYIWYDCVTKGFGPGNVDFDKTISRTDINLHVTANLFFLTCDESSKTWIKKKGAKSIVYTSWYALGGWWFSNYEDTVWPPQ